MRMTHPLPPLAAIRAFDAASRHLSFTRAADELGMTQAAVSYQIKLLEEKLGFALFVRKPRQIELTDKGKRLAGRITWAFEEIRQSFDEIREETANTLIVSSNTTFAVNWLAHRIHAFEAQHPDLNVRIIPYGPAASPEFDTADVVVSACYPPPPDWTSYAIVRAQFSPMLSPALAETIGGVKAPTDILKLPIIDARDPWWGIWFKAAGIPEVKLDHLPFSRMGSQALEANRAIAGQGVAILTPYFCREALAQGLLIQPFGILAEVPDEKWSLCYAPTLRNTRKVRLFRDWVLAELEKDKAAEQAA
ncbi:LysR family transcriptional regulator [Labrenzia sp. CE80]|uniref:LysR family transcriptional regulator n=1 Tax=Labrenzia sp. CE80 TaxID=1788986 RepID=UPI00336A1D35